MGEQIKAFLLSAYSIQVGICLDWRVWDVLVSVHEFEDENGGEVGMCAMTVVFLFLQITLTSGSPMLHEGDDDMPTGVA